MSNIKFSQLPNLGNITANTIVPVVESGVNYTVTTANLQTFVNNSGNITATTVSASGNIQGANLITNTRLWFGTDSPSEYIEADDLTMTFVTNNNTRLFVTSGGGTLQGNLSTTGNVFAATGVSAVGNITGGNIRTAGSVTATGNITGNYLFGNGSQLTGLPDNYGNANVAAYLPTYTGNLAGALLSVTGSVTGANLITSGGVTATGNIQANNISIRNTGNTATAVAAYGNGLVQILTGPLFSEKQAFLSGNLLSVEGVVSAQGNVIGSNLITIGNVTGSSVSASGNITGGNIRTVGSITATGNVTGNYFIGNGSQLTGITANATLSGNLTGNLITSTFTIKASNIASPTQVLFGSALNVSGTGGASVFNNGIYVPSGGFEVDGPTSLETATVDSISWKSSLQSVQVSANTSSSFTPTQSNWGVQLVLANNNFTLNAPSGMFAGNSITLIIRQDAVGNRVMTPNAAYRWAGNVKTLSTAANSIDTITIFYDGTDYLCNMLKGYVA